MDEWLQHTDVAEMLDSQTKQGSSGALSGAFRIFLALFHDADVVSPQNHSNVSKLNFEPLI